MYIKYIENGKFSRDEKDSLYMLFLEEEILGKILDLKVFGTKFEKKLYNYYKFGKFNLVDAGKYTTVDFSTLVKDYDFIIIYDKKNVIVGYLCFEHVIMNRKNKEAIKDILIVKHMYISNSQNHTNFDYKMFWLMENLFGSCIVYSELAYRPCNNLNGFCEIKKSLFSGADGFLKKKECMEYPIFSNSMERANLAAMLSVILNTKEHCCRI